MIFIKTPLKQLIIVCFVFFLAWSLCEARNEMTKELKKAEKLLSKGEYEKAYELYYQFATEKKNPLAQFVVGLFYNQGWGRAVDIQQACQWFEKAAANDIPAAAQFFADCLMDGTQDKSKDPEKAAIWYQKAADLGIKSALCQLGELYIKGDRFPKDVQKGIKLCEQAANERIVPVQLRLGHLLMEKGTGYQDLKRSFYWFSQAAANHAAEAQYYTGLMHQEGLGTEKNIDDALAWFEKAAQAGYEPAYYPVGKLYYTAPKDPENNMILPVNLANSYLWLSAAARQQSDPVGQKKAKQLLEQVRQIMPEAWTKDLDPKVNAHFKSFPTHQP